MRTLGKSVNCFELQCSPLQKMGHPYLFFHWWRLDVDKHSESDSSGPDTCSPLVVLIPTVIPALFWMCRYILLQPHENQGGLSHWFVPCPDFKWFSRTFFLCVPARTWLVCEGVASPLHTAARAQSGAESLGSCVMHFSMAGKMNPGQAKLCLFQKLCHKLT